MTDEPRKFRYLQYCKLRSSIQLYSLNRILSKRIYSPLFKVNGIILPCPRLTFSSRKNSCVSNTSSLDDSTALYRIGLTTLRSGLFVTTFGCSTSFLNSVLPFTLCDLSLTTYFSYLHMLKSNSLIPEPEISRYDSAVNSTGFNLVNEDPRRLRYRHCDKLRSSNKLIPFTIFILNYTFVESISLSYASPILITSNA